MQYDRDRWRHEQDTARYGDPRADRRNDASDRSFYRDHDRQAGRWDEGGRREMRGDERFGGDRYGQDRYAQERYSQERYGTDRPYSGPSTWREHDQGWRGEDRGRPDHAWRGEQDRYSQGRYGQERFGDSRYAQDRPMHDRDRGQRDWWDRATDEVSSWFGDDDAARRRDGDERRAEYAGRGPRGYTRSDDRIRDDMNDRLTDDRWIDASEIEVTVQNGEATLSGQVHSREAKRRAEDIVERISGVKHVQNNLRVMDRNAMGHAGAQGQSTQTAPHQALGHAAERTQHTAGVTSSAASAQAGAGTGTAAGRTAGARSA